MAGIYIHIPFCRQACSYCDFHFSTLQKNRPAFIAALLNEIRLRKDFFPEDAILDTLYFGGGTPSILTEEELASILSELKTYFRFSEGWEFTLEANPDDIRYEKLESWLQSGVNRLSIGIQSFDDDALRMLNRAHLSAEAIESVILAKETGFQNISIDLMYGLPGQSLETWEQNLRKAIHLDVQHISVYALTVEEKTRLAHQVKEGKLTVQDEEGYEKEFLMMRELLPAYGFRQYEISNFAKPGFHSRHNSSYWLGEPYLGLGPSAHSFMHPERSWNLSNNTKYAEAIAAGLLAQEEKEILSATDLHNEFLMTRLRLDEGVSRSEFRRRFGYELSGHPALHKWMESGKLLVEADRIRLSAGGKIVSDAIIRDLFKSEPE